MGVGTLNPSFGLRGYLKAVRAGELDAVEFRWVVGSGDHEPRARSERSDIELDQGVGITPIS